MTKKESILKDFYFVTDDRKVFSVIYRPDPGGKIQGLGIAQMLPAPN